MSSASWARPVRWIVSRIAFSTLIHMLVLSATTGGSSVGCRCTSLENGAVALKQPVVGVIPDLVRHFPLIRYNTRSNRRGRRLQNCLNRNPTDSGTPIHQSVITLDIGEGTSMSSSRGLDTLEQESSLVQ